MNQSVNLLLAVLLILAGPAAEAAKRHLAVDTESPEGRLLKQLTDETDEAKKLTMMEEFSAKHPTHESATWVLGEMQAQYLKANQFDKALAAGEKVLAADPDDVPIAHANLKAAEGIKDLASIRKWALATSDAARRAAKAPKPQAEDEVSHWQANVTFAKQVDAYCDYVLYAQAAQAAAPEQRIELAELLAARSPASEYNKQLRPQLFVAYQRAGNHEKALALAERELQQNDSNDDMLIYAASKAYERQDKAKAGNYAKRLLETLPAKAAPQGVSEADWTKNKNLKLGLGRWMLGVIASGEQKWADADTHLRAALPLVKDNKDLTAECLFHLGLANYKLGDPKGDKNRILDALKFNSQCAAIPGNYQALAKKNMAAIRSQYRIQ